MLRKMEKREFEETSLLEFIKSKELTFTGEGGWGCREVACPISHVRLGWEGTTTSAITG